MAAIYANSVASGVATFDQGSPPLRAGRRRRDGLLDRRLPFLVAETGSQVLGHAWAGPWRDRPADWYTVEDTVYLTPGATGRGQERMLPTALIRDCAQAGMRQLLAVCADIGPPASQALHRACGFAQVGRSHKVGDKHGRWLDTVLWQRELTLDGP